MGTTTYVWDPVFDCVSHELDENNDVKAVYHNEPQQYGGVLSQRRGSTSHYHHYDALGSTRFLTDNSGNVTDTYLHDAWGNEVASTGTTVNPFKWVGKYGYYTDNSIAQAYVRARMYQPTVAKWMSVDPVPFIYSASQYDFVRNAPILFTDPSGLVPSDRDAASRFTGYLLGPEATIVSYIDKFAINAENIVFEMIDAAKRAGLQANVQPGDYHAIVTMLQELATSTNPRPPAGIVSWRHFVTTKEFRGLSQIRMQLSCFCGHITDSTYATYSNHGYTPIRHFNDYGPGEGSEHKTAPSPGYASSIDSYEWEPKYSHFEKYPSCMRYVLKHDFRVGIVGQIISKFVFGAGVPFAWGDIDYRICCNGTYRITYSASHFPSAIAYERPAFGAAKQVDEHNQNDLPRFIFATPNARSGGDRFYVSTGKAIEVSDLMPFERLP